jgi:hypothetical protein
MIICLTVSFKQKIYEKSFFCILTKSHQSKDPDPHPDSVVRGMDPRIRINTQMLWIRNTAKKIYLYQPGQFLKKAF